MKLLVFLLRPTPLESIMYVFAVLLAYFVVAYRTVLDALLGENLEISDISSLSRIFSDNTASFFETFSSSTVSATVVTLLFWSAAGAVVYIVVWTIYNGFVEFYKDTSGSNDLVRGQDVASETLLANIGRLVFRLTTIIVAVTYLLTFFRLFWPLFLGLFESGIVHLGEMSGWVQLLMSIVGGIISLHLFTIIARLVSMRLRVYGQFEIPR